MTMRDSPSNSNAKLGIDSDTSGVSSQSEFDDAEWSDTSASIELNSPARSPLHRHRNHNRHVSTSLPQRSVHQSTSSNALPEFSDDPDDETDEDIADVPLDYGHSKETKLRRQRIEHRWHK